jgi:hypothetical protein
MELLPQPGGRLEPEKSDYNEAKSYRPISLSSFLLKTVEELVDRYIRAGVLKKHPVHRKQHAYQIGKSIETSLHNVVTRIESAIKNKEIALAFLDIEGAFNRTSFDITTQAAERHGTGPAMCKWICSMLESRNMITEGVRR